MKICRICQKEFKTKVEINGEKKNLQNRKYCLECSPYKQHNTKDLLKKKLSAKEIKQKINKKCKKWQNKARQKRKEELIKILGGECKRCGYNKCSGAFDFHHRDPSQKDFSIATHGLLRKWDKVLIEVQKCDLLCATCHRELHYYENRNKEV